MGDVKRPFYKKIDVLKDQKVLHDKNDILSKFYASIRETKLLSVEEEVKLFNDYKTVDNDTKIKIRNKIVLSNMRIIVSLARKYATNVDELQDYIEEGAIGMMVAVDKYKLDKEVRFCSFAVFYVRKYINLFKIDNGSLIQQKNKSRTIHALPGLSNSFFVRNGRMPSNEELMDLYNEKFSYKPLSDPNDVSSIRIFDVDDRCNNDNSPESIIHNEINMASSTINLYEYKISSDNTKEALNNAINKLSKKEKIAINLAYGLNNNKTLSLAEIGEKMCLTKERARQLCVSAIDKLKLDKTLKLSI